ncbi:MAG: hypothetical protein ACI8S6_004899 [Myxococcota bacterium]|jgi:hypothetical protein
MSPLMFLFLACNPDPGELDQTVGYRDGSDDGPTSGERGSVKISEILWSGSVTNDGTHDSSDVFIEIRNESARPIRITDWQLTVSGAREQTYLIPDPVDESGLEDGFIEVGQHVFIATKTTGCFPAPHFLIPELELPYGDGFRLTLRDADERLIEPVGSEDAPTFAGGYDYVRSRSMERVELMFGGAGSEPSSWHYYTPAEVDVPNNTFVAEGCQDNTLASPGLPNSPDYSGAYSTGSFE